MLKTSSLSDAIDAHAPKILVYGEAGTGKTRLTASLRGRKLLLSAEAGLRSLKSIPEKHRDNGPISVIGIKSITQLRAIHAELERSCDFDWVCLDSVSELAEICLAELKRKSKDPRAAYGDVHDQVLEMLRAFRDLPCGVYFSAKERKDKDEATGRISVGISMPGSKLSPAIPYLFDEIFRLEVISRKNEDGTSTEEPWLLTRNNGRCAAKDRSGMLEPYEEADLGLVCEKIHGGTSATPTTATKEDDYVDDAASEGIEQQ